MIKILINGINGKMGREVLKSANSNEKFEVVAGVDLENKNDTNFPVYNNIEEVKGKIDVIIDFSVPKASIKALEYAKNKNIPIVIATTGFNETEMEKIREISKEIPVFQSFNMAYSINVMKKIVAELAKKLEGYDIEIVETHHRRKVDSPSGTALILANSVNEALGNTMDYEYNRHDKHEKRPQNEIGIHSIRGGTESGKHTVMFFGENESFEITHNATSRSIFSNGALKAAEFITSIDKPGYYNMDNL